MNRILSSILIIGTALLCSCAKTPNIDIDEVENHAIRSWMKIHHPDLLDNLQENGMYYVDVQAWGEEGTPKTDNDFGSEPIMDQDTAWMFYNFTCRDLKGNVIISRNEMLSRMQGTFENETHYTPFLIYCGSANRGGLYEGSFLAVRHELTLGEEYVKNHSDICKSTTMKLRKGSKVRLYMPSTIAYGTESSNANGGYQGQYTLDANSPVIMDLEVLRVVKNPSEKELAMLDEIITESEQRAGSGTWLQIPKWDDDKSQEEKADSTKVVYYTGLKYTNRFNPVKSNDPILGFMRPEQNGISLSKQNAYQDSDIWKDAEENHKKIREILNEKFKDTMTDPESLTDDDLVGKSGTAKIHYVGCFMDGFVFDSNIKEIKELLFKETNSSGSALSFCPENDGSSYIAAWKYAIPLMHFGSFGAIITPSGFAYGEKGISASTTTTSTGNDNYYMSNYGYTDFYNNYYGYYNYYNSYYNPYQYGYYNNVYDTTAGSSSTISSTNTEILPYTPLIFYLFIEPKK